jgi:AcrR family transcriptional regulator
MTRWEPDARGRLQRAALVLYSERGYDQTTVAEIAKQAGLTERTYFRHFADKREVLFYGAAVLQDHLVKALTEAPAALPAIDAVGVALETSLCELGLIRELAWQRQAIIAANPELRERELIKLAALAAAMADALRGRGVPDPAASLAAEAGVAVFKIAFQRWSEGADEAAGQTLPQVAGALLAELKKTVGTA